MSDRYISDRFLPDKAIDLVDEASARLKTQKESKPAEIEQLERRENQLKIEREALRAEKDDDSKRRLSKIEKEIADLTGELAGLRSQWERERSESDRVATLKQEIENKRRQLEQAEKATDWELAARIQKGELPVLEASLADAESALTDESGGSLLREEVTAEDIAAVVARWTGIPVSRLMASERQKLLSLPEILHERILGQDEPVRAVSDAVLRSRAGLADPQRPVGSFLFLGPTGVGKTELARSLAHALFDDERNMIRVDMSEYQERHSVARLIGAPPGYVGHEEGGQLTEAVRRKPYAVVLFDEIEKAHPEVFNTLLQVLDDGRLTDGRGRTVDFKNVILIMTSNIGSELILERLSHRDPSAADEEYERVSGEVLALVRRGFRPEFLNRIDEMIVFRPLSKEDLRGIVELQVAGLRSRLADSQVELGLTESALGYIAEQGYDSAWGARPLKRAIQRELETPLARLLLSGEAAPGSRVTVEAGGSGLTFRAERGVAASGA